jgi:hypothetical protein
LKQHVRRAHFKRAAGEAHIRSHPRVVAGIEISLPFGLQRVGPIASPSPCNTGSGSRPLPCDEIKRIRVSYPVAPGQCVGWRACTTKLTDRVDEKMQSSVPRLGKESAIL